MSVRSPAVWFEQVYDAHRLRGSPTCFSWDFRREHPAVGAYRLIFPSSCNFRSARRDKRFADRADAKFRVAGHLAARGEVGLADSPSPEKLPVREPKPHPRPPGYALFVEHVLSLPFAIPRRFSGAAESSLFCCAPPRAGRQCQCGSEKR